MKISIVCLWGFNFGTYHWQFALFQLLSAPVEVADVTTSHNPMERMLQNAPTLIIQYSPIEHMGIGAASQQQVQQCLMGNIEMDIKPAEGDSVRSRKYEHLRIAVHIVTKIIDSLLCVHLQWKPDRQKSKAPYVKHRLQSVLFNSYLDIKNLLAGHVMPSIYNIYNMTAQANILQQNYNCSKVQQIHIFHTFHTFLTCRHTKLPKLCWRR